jgi:hypothetical protein
MPNYQSRSRGVLTPPGSTNFYGSHGLPSYGQVSKPRNTFYEQVPYGPAQPMLYAPPMNYNNVATSAPGIPSYGPVGGARGMPAERSNDTYGSRREQDHEQRRTQRQPAKQEKVVGGVAQELDYEMDQMTDYVAEMAQELYALYSNPHICMADIDVVRSVMPRSNVAPPFRKFISQILSSTRLPSSTILLGLNYLAKRMSMLNAAGPYKSSEGQVWRMITIALLLGSKFLDDNTFQNKSWSEVSGINVKELNTLETEWLSAIDFRLHVDFSTDTDFHLWLASWASWKEAKNQQRAANLERLAPLAPLDTNVQRQPSPRKSHYSSPTQYENYGQQTLSAHPSTYSTPSTYPSTYASQSAYPSSSRYEQPPWSAPASEMSPPSAPESGPNTPEWLMLPHGSGMPPVDFYGYDAFYARRQQTHSSHGQYAPAQPAAYNTPYHGQYSQGAWTGHPAGCGCAYCCRPSESYFMHGGYGQQTVAG